MKDLAIKYYYEGYNCSQCIIKAFESKYGRRVSADIYSGLNAVNTGMGIGGMCSAIVAGVIIFGLVFDNDTAHRARLRLLSAFDNMFGTVYCSGLNRSKNRYGGCTEILSTAAFLIEEILRDEGIRPIRQ